MARGLCTPGINIPSDRPCEQLLRTKGRPGDSLCTLTAPSAPLTMGHEEGRARPTAQDCTWLRAVQPWPAVPAMEVTWLQVTVLEGCWGCDAQS